MIANPSSVDSFRAGGGKKNIFPIATVNFKRGDRQLELLV